ncbi:MULTISPECIES: hypothetical protein [unclassified Pannonibacter]|uniref:hypothetical protein n=1 Tax=unclassified Pannonibacter TaxID=2627228 RepID=UPI00164857AB|nr:MULTISPECIES: hypothetical protein [unclassified Pannonibacter]
MAGSVPEIEAIKDRETLEAYLTTRPVAESQVLAFRSALRVMPLAVRSQQKITKSRRGLLFVFKSALFSHCAHVYRARQRDFRLASENVYTDPDSSDPRIYSAGVITFAFSTSASTNTIAHAAVVVASFAGIAGMRQVVRDDVSRIRKTSGIDSLTTPLWRKGAEPRWYADWETNFRQVIRIFGPEWNLVYEFYESLRDGLMPFSHLGSQAEDVLLALAKEGGGFWERHPSTVMRDLAERLGGNIPSSVSDGEIDAVQENLTQVAADFRFSENEKGAIDALPFSELARDPGFAGTTLSEAREKAQELADRLKRANAPGRVVRSVTRLLEALPEQLGDLNPALLRSRSRSLEADAVAYGAAGAEAELFPDAVSELLDVVGTLNDLQGCFPAIAEVERNIAAIDIAGREDKVQPELSVISASARELSAQYPHVMTEAAAEAVAALDADIADAADLEVKRDLLARSLLIKRNFLSAVYRKVLSPAGREALRVGKLHYDGAISGSVEGVKKLAASAFPAVVAFYFTGPVGVLAVLLTGQFKSLKDAKDVVDRLKSDGQRSENDQD